MKRFICLLLLAAGIVGFSGCSRTENLENSVVRLAKAVEDQNELLGKKIGENSKQENEAAEEKPEEFNAVILMEGMEESILYTRYDGVNFDLYYDPETFAYGEIDVSKDSLINLVEMETGMIPEERISFYPLTQKPGAGITVQMNVFCYRNSALGTADMLMKIVLGRTLADYQTDFTIIEQTAVNDFADGTNTDVVKYFRGVRQIEEQMHYIWVNETTRYIYVMEYLVPSDMYEGFGARFQDMIQYLQYQK